VQQQLGCHLIKLDLCVLMCAADLVLKGVVRVEDINPIDEKVDVWSFGVTVYELVTGVSCASQCDAATYHVYAHQIARQGAWCGAASVFQEGCCSCP
jgi:hypothetical protein